MYIGLHVKYVLFLSDFNDTWTFFGQFYEKYSNTKFHENLCSGSSVVPCGWTDAKLTVAFRKFANAPKKLTNCGKSYLSLRYV